MKSKNSHHHIYIRTLENKVLERYKELVERNDPEIATLLKRKEDLCGTEDERSNRHKVKNNRIKSYVEFWNTLSKNQQLKLSEHDAKINHMARLMANIGTTEVVQAHNKIKATTAGSFDYVLQKFRHEDVTPAQLQTFIDENAVAWFSLTGHPTNPTTVSFTKALINLAKVISDQNAHSENLMGALNDIYETPIVAEHKTPLQEAEEILATMNVIYDTALPHKRFFEDSLHKYKYADEGVVISKPLIVPCVWTLGDGDGNSSLTAEVLEEGIKLHRSTIAARYLETLNQLDLKNSKLEKIKLDIEKNNISKDDLLDRVQTLANEISQKDIQKALLDFAYLVKCFGMGFATIDIRHNAIEILDTAYRLAVLCDLTTPKDLENIALNQSAEKIAQWLGDEEIIKKMSALSAETLLQTGDEAAARIFGRLRVIGKNPDMCDKLIIAETTHPAHALAALLLLKASGNAVGEAGSKIDITVLSESVKDLLDLGQTLESLLENKIFRQHVASRKRLLVMIAKSDTTRQDGRGEAEYIQYETAVDIYRVADTMKRKYPELENVATSIKNGGGHALQRGGGRVTEIAALHGRAAADARVTDCGPSTLTIQGEQLTILLCPGKVALGTLEAFVAQNLYTKAGVRGEMPVPHYEKNINKQFAQADAWTYAKTAGKAFDLFTKKSSAIDDLLINAPWLSMKAGNASSRPAKRGEKTVEPGITPEEAKGENPKALQGRAISGERLTAHACLPVFSVLGLVEAMKMVRYHGQARANPHKYGDALHHLYRAHKIHRDGARVTINAVRMADFDIAWPLLAGKPRPNDKKIEELANKFLPEKKSNPEETLAFLEQYFLNAEKLSYEMVSGQKGARNFKAGDALKKLWPELAEQVEHRDRRAEFARVIECYRTRQFDHHETEPLSIQDFRITQGLYAAANVVNAPVGILATRTRLEPVDEYRGGKKVRLMKPKSFNEADVQGMLKIPAALQ